MYTSLESKVAEIEKQKMRSTDRILVLQPMEGKKATTTTGLVDTRLFKGGNRLHAVRDKTTSLWYMKYDEGILPDPLKQKFTSFKSLADYARAYFEKRNIQIVEIQD